MFWNNKKKTEDRRISELLNEEKETVHILNEYADILNDVMDAININGIYIPLSDFFKRLKPLYLDEFTEEQVKMINGMKENLIDKVVKAGYFLDTTNGFYICMKQDKENNAITIYRTKDNQYIFDTHEECTYYNQLDKDKGTVLMHFDKEDRSGMQTLFLLDYTVSDNVVTAYVETDIFETTPHNRNKSILFKFMINFEEKTVKLYKKNAIRKTGENYYIKKISDIGWYPHWKEAYVFVSGTYEFPKENSKSCVIDFICNYFSKQNEMVRKKENSAKRRETFERMQSYTKPWKI